MLAKTLIQNIYISVEVHTCSDAYPAGVTHAQTPSRLVTNLDDMLLELSMPSNRMYHAIEDYMSNNNGDHPPVSVRLLSNIEPNTLIPFGSFQHISPYSISILGALKDMDITAEPPYTILKPTGIVKLRIYEKEKQKPWLKRFRLILEE